MTVKDESPRQRRGVGMVLWIVGGALLLALVVVFAVLLTRGLGESRGVLAEETAEPGSAVHVDASSATIEVEPSRDSRVHARVEGFSLFGPPVLVVRTQGATTEIGARCPSAPFSFCITTLKIQMPPAVPLTVDGKNGAITIEGMNAKVTAATQNGAITVRSSSGDLMLRTTNGSVRVDGVRSSAIEARSVNGAVDVDLASAPERVTAETTNGSVRVHVPDAGPYAIDASTVNGGTAVERVVDDPAARRSIVARSVNGRVDVVGEKRG